MKRLGQISFSPFLLAAYPVIFLYSRNLGSVSPSIMVTPFLIAMAAATLLNGLCALLLRNWRKGALVTDVLLFSSYVWTSGIDTLCPWIYGTRFSMLIVIIILIVILWTAWKIGALLHKISDLSHWGAIVNLCCILLLLVPLIQVGWYQWNESILKPSISLPAEEAPSYARPDVYYIILDGYARSDILQKDMGYDNRPFTNFLRRNGFFVAGKSRSNYAYTFLSLASSLNMNYISELNQAPDQQTECIRRIGASSVMRLFRMNGYHVIHFAPVWQASNIDAYAETTFNPRTVNEFENLLIKRFLLRAFLKQGVTNLYKLRTRYTLHQLEELPKDPRSKFVFAHILCPHPPFVFDRSGNTPEPRFYSNRPPGSHDWYPKERYVDQVDYLNRLVKDVILHILKDSKGPPIIILQGDHGAASDGTSDHPTPLMIRERMSILNAYYVPIELRKQLYPSISPVNTFRLIGNYLFHAKFAHLPDNNYYSGPMDALPYEFIDVTKRLSEENNE